MSDHMPYDVLREAAGWSTDPAMLLDAIDALEQAESNATDALGQLAHMREARDNARAKVERLTGELVDAGYRQAEDRAEIAALRSMLDAADKRPLAELARQVNDNARAHGFWEVERTMGEMLMLAVSELSEALEEHREGRPNVYHSINARRVYPVVDASGADWTTHPDGLSLGDTYTGVKAKPEGVAVELADALIRILDTMHSLGVDIDAVVAEKMAYNAARPFKHGKAY